MKILNQHKVMEVDGSDGFPKLKCVNFRFHVRFQECIPDFYTP